VAASGSAVQKARPWSTRPGTSSDAESTWWSSAILSGAAEFLGNRIRSNVINAGDRQARHPTQALPISDHPRQTRQDRRLKVWPRGRRPALGVARSNIWSPKLGAEVGVCGPDTLLPRASEELGVCRFRRIEEAIEWPMSLNVLRLQLKR